VYIEPSNRTRCKFELPVSIGPFGQLDEHTELKDSI
jgi:hypothetical protein